MKNYLLKCNSYSAILLIAICFFCFECNSQESGDSATLKEFSDLVKGIVDDGKVIGAEILVLKNGENVLHETYGLSDRENNKPLLKNSIYRIRSMTKPFIGTSILMLQEEGKLKINDPVGNYIQSYQNENSGKITIYHLLTHTSGFRQGDFPPGYWETGNLRNAVDLLGLIGPSDPVGENYTYSDKNSATMGAIIEQLTGDLAEKFLKERILDPLGMIDTYSHYAPDYSWRDRMNSTYQIRDNVIDKYWDNSMPQTTPFFRASGGLYTTVKDYARILSVIMNLGVFEDGVLLENDTILQAVRRIGDVDYGYHWEVFEKPEGDETLPPFGHGGSDGTFAIAIPSQDMIILYFTQTRGTPTIRKDVLPFIKENFIR